MCGNEESLTRYNALVAQKELEQHPNFVWCTNAQCGKGQIHYEGAISPLVICYNCHAYACFIHRVPWHNNLTCEQYSKHEEANKASEEHIDMHMKRCPNIGCKRPIEKIDGCDHMTCRRPGGCGYEFCWICLADYGPIRIEGNHKHNTDCRHFADQSQRHDNPDAPPTVRRTRRRVCRGRVPVAAAPAINAEDEPLLGRRPDTPIPPESTSSPSPTSSSPIQMPPLNLLPDIYSLSLLAFPPPIQPSFSHYSYGVLPESTSNSLGPRVVLSAEACGSGHVHTNTSELPIIIRSPPSPTPEDNMTSRSPTPVPPLRSLPRTEARSGSPERVYGPHCSSLIQPTGFQRSELYWPPPPRRVIPQELITTQPSREGALRDSTPGGRLLFEQGEERHLSSIPDFESEIVLDFIVRR
ncbi:hypothetical protein RSOLAG22IIIB_11891 [Rhizoctonia solani]|uniref:RBR-type E3 ubiquitin transferase n=1 Tax=Rhizoctonia solani TaxID=456999 RepID=A0A0K6GB99_9AGAM|nr:hypothetical protein RSOLAG22IIIB_11891 [Rhizoctonia solani]